MFKSEKATRHSESGSVTELSDQSLLAVFGGTAQPSSGSGGDGNGTPTSGSGTGSGSSGQQNGSDNGGQGNTWPTGDASGSRANGNGSGGEPTGGSGGFDGSGAFGSSGAGSQSQSQQQGDGFQHGHHSAREALEHGIYEIANGVADLAVAFIESLPHGHGFQGAGFDFSGNKGRNGRA